MDSNSGNYIVSKFKNAGIKKFVSPKSALSPGFMFRTGKLSVINQKILVTPGPGTYLLPSDFGILESATTVPPARAGTHHQVKRNNRFGDSMMT
jgi:hypothetical protein